MPQTVARAYSTRTSSRRRRMVEHMIQFLTEYGYMLLLAWVLAEQFGFPLPAAPVLLAAGALAGRGVFQLGTALAVGVSACMLGALFWFHMGRICGGGLLNFIAGIELKTACRV